MDQYTATVINTSITVVSTLIAAFGGIIINNNYTAKKEKRDKTTAAIEEALQIVLQVDNAINFLLSDIKSKKDIQQEYFFEKIQKTRVDSTRVSVLVRLHMSTIKETLLVYNHSIAELWNEAQEYNIMKENGDPLDNQNRKLEEARARYKKCLSEMLEKMEKLIK